MQLSIGKRTRLATAGTFAVLILSMLLLGQAGTLQAQEDADTVWMLVDTSANPNDAQTEYYGGGRDPHWYNNARYEGKHQIFEYAEGFCRLSFREVDGVGVVWHDVTFPGHSRTCPLPCCFPENPYELEAVIVHEGGVNLGSRPLPSSTCTSLQDSTWG